MWYRGKGRVCFAEDMFGSKGGKESLLLSRQLADSSLTNKYDWWSHGTFKVPDIDIAISSVGVV